MKIFQCFGECTVMEVIINIAAMIFIPLAVVFVIYFMFKMIREEY